ncbi:NAD(P)H-binding protein [Actinocorallia longicatena]|uniref:NAD(P)H-binding protein n=1 Tax=Actinocorallia longicatena TaxID=111803 RepID=UPI003CD0A8F5
MLDRARRTRALVHEQSSATGLPGEADLVVGDLASAETLAEAADGVDAIVFTHGSHGGAGRRRSRPRRPAGTRLPAGTRRPHACPKITSRRHIQVLKQDKT